MPPVAVDLGIVVLILGITYALASEGLWGAALMFFNVLFAGLIAFNCYEPLAGLLAQNVSRMAGFADSVCLMGIFIVSLLLLRLATETLAPTMIRFPAALYHIGRWVFGLAAASLMMSIVLLAFHTSPVHKKMFYGAYDYERKPPFGMGLDWFWLGFFQYNTGQIFARYAEANRPDPFGAYGNARVFDPRGSWLIDHQNARPYGEGTVPPPPSSAAPAAEGAEGGAGPAAGGAAAGGGLGIPGGTAGAAVGMAPL